MELSHFIKACHSDFALGQEDVVFGVLENEVSCKNSCGYNSGSDKDNNNNNNSSNKYIKAEPQ